MFKRVGNAMNYIMRIVISISKTELCLHPELGARLTKLCNAVKEFEHRCVYIPNHGRLINCRNILREYDIIYTVQYDHAITLNQ
jgi:hypothetical protein